MASNAKYSDPWSGGADNELECMFEITTETGLIVVQIPSADIGKDAAQRGLPIPVTADEHLDHVRCFQPEIVSVALKQHRANNTVLVESWF